MNLFDLLDLWKEHWFIGSIIGILVVALVCEIYKLPFMINSYISDKMEEIEDRKEMNEQIHKMNFIIIKYLEACSNNMKVEQINLETFIHLFALQCSIQDSSYRYETKKEYDEKVEEIYSQVLEIFKKNNDKK